MEYNQTAQTWNLLPEEVKILRELFESRGYQLLREMEKTIKEGAQARLEFATDIQSMCRGQGILEGFRLRDGALKAIYDQATKEEEETTNE